MTGTHREPDNIPNHLMRHLKGASLAVFLALALCGEQGRPDLVRNTG